MQRCWSKMSRIMQRDFFLPLSEDWNVSFLILLMTLISDKNSIHNMARK